MLIVFGFAIMWFLFLSAMGFSSGGPAKERWHFVISLSVPLFIISGIALFSFKEWARKLAIVSYVVALSHLIFDYVECYYRIAIFFKHKFNFFGETGFFENTNLIGILIFSFFLAVLFLSKEQFQSKENARKSFKKTKLVIEFVTMISILTLFGSFYFSVITLVYKEHKGQIEAQRYIELITPRIKNDPRFQKVNFEVDYGGYPFANGMVMNEEDWQALQDIMSSLKFPTRLGGWVGIDNADIIGTGNPDINPSILVNIGSIETTYKEQVVNLLEKNSIANSLWPSKLSPSDIHYIYVSPAKREKAISLLKQDAVLGEKYFPKVDRPDSIKVGTENFVNIGFIEMSHATHIFSLLNNNGIRAFPKNAQYPGYSVYHIYVLPEKKEQAINLLKQDSSLGEEYCSK